MVEVWAAPRAEDYWSKFSVKAAAFAALVLLDSVVPQLPLDAATVQLAENAAAYGSLLFVLYVVAEAFELIVASFPILD